MCANVLLPRSALREAPTYRILEAQQAAAVVWRLDRRGRQGAVATGAHARALRTTAELLQDVAARRTLPLFSMGSYVGFCGVWFLVCYVGRRRSGVARSQRFAGRAVT